MSAGENWFDRLYGDGYRELVLTAHALLDDMAAAEAVTRDALAVAYKRQVRLAAEEHPLEWVRAEVVRRVRRRQRWRALPRRAATDPDREAARLHRLAGLPPETIASIVDRPVETVEAAIAAAGPVSWVSVWQPAVRWVHARATQRTTRKRMLAVAAAAVVVLAVTVPLLRVDEVASPAAAPPSTSATPLQVAAESFVFNVTFVDERHGFALRSTCRGDDCGLDLLATRDGRRWSSRPVLKPAGKGSMTGLLVALGPEDVAVDWYPMGPGGGDDERYRMHTADAGRTWRQVAVEPRRTLREIPDGAALVPSCLAGDGTCEQVEPTVVLPGTGETARLASAPKLRRVYAGPMPLEGDRWWMSGIEPRTRKWAVAISDDDGRSWTVSPLLPPRKELDDFWAVVGYGEDLYAFDTGEVARGDYGVVAIFHSGDGGTTWQRTGRVPEAMNSLVAAADGTLLTTTEAGTTLISHDHGRSFTETTKRYNGYAYWAGAGYVAVYEPQWPIMFSRDGVRWHRLHLGS